MVFLGVTSENTVILTKLIGHCKVLHFFFPLFVVYASDVPVGEMQFVSFICVVEGFYFTTHLPLVM